MLLRALTCPKGAFTRCEQQMPTAMRLTYQLHAKEITYLLLRLCRIDSTSCVASARRRAQVQSLEEGAFEDALEVEEEADPASAAETQVRLFHVRLT